MSGRAELMKRLSEATASGVGNNFRDGKYRLIVKGAGLPKGYRGSRFQTTFVVMNAIKVPVTSLQTKEQLDIEPNAVGEEVDWLCMLDGKDSPGPGNMRRFILDLVGKKDMSNKDYFETIEEVCDVDSDGVPLPEPKEMVKGLMIDMSTVRIVTKTNKVEIVVCKWSHVETSEEDQRANIEWLNALGAQKAAAAAAEA